MLRRKSRSSRNWPVGDHLPQVAVGRAEHAHVDRIGSFSPSRWISPDSRNRSSFTWMFLFSSPSSSRNSVPPLATSKRPLWSRSAPVNAPFLWPNSSLSTRFCVSAPQLTGHERHVGPLALDEERAGDHFLAGAGLAEDQHAAVGRGDPVDELLHRAASPGCRADQPGRALGGLHAALEGRGLVLELALLLNAEQQRLDLGELARLGEVVERAEPQGLDGGLGAGVAGHDDGFGVGRDLLERREDFEPGLVGPMRRSRMAASNVPFFERLDGGLAVGADRDLVPEPRQLGPHELAQVRLRRRRTECAAGCVRGRRHSQSPFSVSSNRGREATRNPVRVTPDFRLMISD